jgi:hypothetical protein
VAHDLSDAMLKAMTARRADCVAFGRRHGWDRAVDQFLDALVLGDGGATPFLPAPGGLSAVA